MYQSDETIKENIKEISEGLEALEHLQSAYIDGSLKTIHNATKHLRDLRRIYYTELIKREMVDDLEIKDIL